MPALVITGYRAMTPGVYRPQSPPKDVTVAREDVQDFVDAVNRKMQSGAPVVLKIQHVDGLASIECGVLSRAEMRGDDAFVDISILTDAIYQGKIVRTQQQVYDGLRTGMMTCSWEGWNNYQSPAYTGDRTFRIWPTAYAVLLGGDQPAIPSAIPAAAGENTDPSGVYLFGVATAPVGGNSPRERGSAEMTLEQALAKIVELEAKIADLTAAADKDKEAEVVAARERATAAERKATDATTELTTVKSKLAEYAQKDADALKVKAGELQKVVLEKVLAAKRPALETKLAAMDSDATRVQFLELMTDNLDGLQADPAKLADGDPDKGGDKITAMNKAAETRAAEKHIPFAVALEQLVREKEQE